MAGDDGRWSGGHGGWSRRVGEAEPVLDVGQGEGVGADLPATEQERVRLAQEALQSQR